MRIFSPHFDSQHKIIIHFFRGSSVFFFRFLQINLLSVSVVTCSNKAADIGFGQLAITDGPESAQRDFFN